MNTVIANQISFNPAGGEAPLLDLFQENLPQKCYCTDELGSLFVREKAHAIKRRYIQQNSPFELYWLVYDVDRPTAHFDWYDRNAPAPNMTAMNPENGHAHLFYGLEVPVLKCEFNPAVRKAPIRYAGAIDVALTKKLEADPGYAGFICKNPLHKHWNVQTVQPVPYDLHWLADYLDLEPYRDRRKHLPPIGLGRNCTLFDVSRHWAYRQIGKGGFLSEDFFVYEVTQYAGERNQEFSVPLPWVEVKATGKSIGRWTWKNMSPEGKRQWHISQNLKSQKVRKAKSEQRADEIRAYKEAHPELSNRKIAAIFTESRFKVSEFTIRKALRGL